SRDPARAKARGRRVSRTARPTRLSDDSGLTSIRAFITILYVNYSNSADYSNQTKMDECLSTRRQPSIVRHSIDHAKLPTWVEVLRYIVLSGRRCSGESSNSSRTTQRRKDW